MPDFDSLIWVDISTDAVRVQVPECMCKRVFGQIHNISRLSHPRGKVSIDLIKHRFYWKSMKRDINRHAQNYVACQKAIVQHHDSYFSAAI